MDGQAYSVRRGLQRAEARIVAIHPELDIAVLQTDVLQSSGRLVTRMLAPQLGETVFACGYPLRPFLGHSLSITSGLVSATSRGNSVWISAPIQKGNSGGPVFDEFGQVLSLVNNRLSSNKLQKVLDRLNLRLDSQDGLQLMNFAVPIASITDFLRVHTIPYQTHLSLRWPDPEDVQSMKPREVAERAQLVCVEVESWQTIEQSDSDL